MITIAWEQDTYYFFQGKFQQQAVLEEMSPLDWLAGSLGLCIMKTVEQLLQRDKLKLEEYEVSVETVKAEKGPSRVHSFYIDISFPLWMEETYRTKLIKMAERACTVGNTLQYGADIIIQENGKEN